MIRVLKPDEVSLTRELAFAFFKESGIGGSLNFDHFCQQWANYIHLDIGCIMLYIDSLNRPVGIIGGLCVQCSLTADIIAQETFWFVDQSVRGGIAGFRLLARWEIWAIKKQAARIYVGNLFRLNNEAMQSIYYRLGYSPTEVHYVKET